jgi:hypothetical protein
VRIRLWIFGILIVVSALGVAPMAQAATISASAAYPMSLTDWSGPLSIARFDPALGTLTGIKFRLAGSVQGDVRFESLNSTPATVQTFLQATITLSRPDFTPLVVTIPVANNSDYVLAYDGVLDFGGASGRSYLGLAASDADSILSPPPLTDLVAFTGVTPISLPIAAVGASHVSGAGNLVASFRTLVSASMMVTYTYDPWPTGACCHPDGQCQVTLWTTCTGQWTLDGVCVPNTCEQPPVGACCDHATGDCAITTASACAFTWLGPGTTCDASSCPPPVFEGACCAPNGDCRISIQAQCPGTWILGGACSPNPCPQPPIGFCCDALGICMMTTQDACAGQWTVGGTCTPNPCPPIPVETRSWGGIKNLFR